MGILRLDIKLFYMRIKSTPSIIGLTAKCLLLLISAFLAQIQAHCSEHHYVRPTLIVEDSTSGIEAYFKGDNVPIDAKQIKVAGLDFYCIAAFPYSGARTIDVYCYVHDGD